MARIPVGVPAKFVPDALDRTHAKVRTAEGWVQRELLHYEDSYTVVEPVTFTFVTFNVATKKPPADLSFVLGYNGTNGSSAAAAAAGATISGAPIPESDVVVIGLQEVDMSAAALLREETEAALPWERGLREAIGCDADISGASTRPFYPIATKQLVGLMTCVFVRKTLLPFVQEIRVSTLATGALGAVANKGAIGVRWRLHATTVCIINAHLAAHQEKVSKRNEDTATILANLTFSVDGAGLPPSPGSAAGPSGGSPFGGTSGQGLGAGSGAAAGNNGGVGVGSSAGGPTTATSGAGGDRIPSGVADVDAKSHDVVFVIGDLNYRIDMPYAEAVAHANAGHVSFLLRKDQLVNEMKDPHSPWRGFTDLSPTFPPTYRYDLGTSVYDTSEKKRVPSFTDRICFWTRDRRHAGVQVLQLEAVRRVVSSDHKPVRAVCAVPVKRVVEHLRRETIHRLRGSVANLGLDGVTAAAVRVAPALLAFPPQRFAAHGAVCVLTVENTGDCVARVAVRRRVEEDHSGGNWLRVSPVVCELLPRASIDIEVTAVLDVYGSRFLINAAPFASGSQGSLALRSLLIVEVSGGGSHFVECTTTVAASCFGNTLGHLAALHRVPCRAAYDTAAVPPVVDLSRPALPKEIWLLVDVLYRGGLRAPELFAEEADAEETRAVIDRLDCASDSPLGVDAATPLAYATTLLLLLRSLQDSVVPRKLFNAALAAGRLGPRGAMTFVSAQLPPIHCNVFIYLMAFLRCLLRPANAACNELTPEFAASVFAAVLLPTPEGAAPAATGAAPAGKALADQRAVRAQQRQEAAAFVLVFLVDDGRVAST